MHRYSQHSVSWSAAAVTNIEPEASWLLQPRLHNVHAWLGGIRLRHASLYYYIYNTALRSRVHASHTSSHSLCSLASQTLNFFLLRIAKNRLGTRLLLATLDEWSRADPWMLPLDSGWVGTAGLIHTIQFACTWIQSRGNPSVQFRQRYLTTLLSIRLLVAECTILVNW